MAGIEKGGFRYRLGGRNKKLMVLGPGLDDRNRKLRVKCPGLDGWNRKLRV